MVRSRLAIGAAAILVHGSALAQTVDERTPVPQDASPAPIQDSYHEDPHAEPPGEIVITGFRRRQEDILSGTAVLSGEDLDRELRNTIGETLARQPGVSATSFGPNASRPVLRGFQGERVRVLTDGIGSLDASSTSVDHAVAINPLTAQRIEVLRGPSALLFGSAAIGGVVNVIDRRIPRSVPDEPVHVEGLLTYGTAADERSANGAVDVPLGEKFVVHFDGNYSKSDDLEVGGYLLGKRLRAEAAASPDAEIREQAELRGRLPNSAARTWDLAGGLAYISGDTHVGLSVNRYDNLYGVPPRFSLDPDIEAEAPRIHIRQTRADARAEIDMGSGFIDSIRMRGGYSDYRHDELEEDGEIGTSFFSDGYEGRVEFVQSLTEGWGGGFGLHYFRRKFDVEGEEKFLPRNDTQQFGLFFLQSLDLGKIRLEAGGRYEHSRLRAFSDADIGNPDLKRSFDAFSGSVGASYALGPRTRIGINASHSQRAPSAEELFANGPHAGTQSFQIGNPDLSKERSWGLEGTFRTSGNGYRFGASVYHSWFKDYIFDQFTGEIEDDLPVFQNLQADARYLGFELEGSLRVARIGGFAVNVDGLADYVRATIDDSGPAPRIPPLRLLGGVEFQGETLDARAEVEWVDRQKRLAQLETPTDGYVMVNLSLAFHPWEDNSSSITLSANNIFDVTARRHASFLKDFAPLAGRDLRISARFAF